MTADGLRIVIPFVPDMLHPLTRAWGQRQGAEFHDVGRDREAYCRLLKKLWADGRAFMTVEQDLVPAGGTVEELARCADQWCGCPYDYGGNIKLSGPGHLGCTRFSGHLLAEYPRAVAESEKESVVISRGGRDYEYLSARLATVLLRQGQRFHQHDREAIHHHAPGDIHRQNMREFLDLVSAMRHHRLEADLAWKFRDEAAAVRAERMWRQARRLIASTTSRLAPADLAAMPEVLRSVIQEVRRS